MAKRVAIFIVVVMCLASYCLPAFGVDGKPEVSTESAVSSNDGASLSAHIDNMGSSAVTQYGFEWGKTADYSNSVNVTSSQQQFYKVRTIINNEPADGLFDNPKGIAFDQDGNIYVLDVGNNRVQKFDSHYNFVSTFGGQGNSVESTPKPVGIVNDGIGHIAVVTSGNGIIRFNTNGSVASVFKTYDSNTKSVLYDPRAIASDQSGTLYFIDGISGNMIMVDANNTVVGSWQNARDESRDFKSSGSTVGVAPNGDIYYVLTSSADIDIYSANGIYKRSITTPYVGINSITFDQSGFLYVQTASNTEFEIRKYRTDNGEAVHRYILGSRQITGINISPNNKMFVTDRNNNEVLVLNNNMSLEDSFGSFGSLYLKPEGITTDVSGNIWVTDGANGRIKKLSPQGSLLQIVSGVGHVRDIAIDQDGNILTYNDTKLFIFDGAGNAIDSWVLPQNINGLEIRVQNSSIYITSNTLKRIYKFDYSGKQQGTYGSPDPGLEQLFNPYTFSLDSSGNVYVADSNVNGDSTKSIIKVFSSSGAYLKSITSPATTQVFGMDRMDDGSLLLATWHALYHINSDGVLLRSAELSGEVKDIVVSNNLIYLPNLSTQSIDIYSIQVPDTFILKATSLECGATYHYRAFADNASGRGYGQDQTFSTNPCLLGSSGMGDPPAITLFSPSNLTKTSAQLNAVLTDDGGSSTTVSYEYGTDNTYGGTKFVGVVNNGAYAQTTLEDLTCGVTYHYRVVATNGYGTTYGADSELQTVDVDSLINGGCTPTVSVSKESTDYTSMTMHATVSTTNLANVTSYGVQWGLGDVEEHTISSAGPLQNEYFYEDITGLECGTSYYIRAYVTSDTGTGYSQTIQEYTQNCPPLQSDISLESSLEQTGVIKSGDNVTLRMNVDNLGPNDVPNELLVYIIAPLQFELDNSVSDNFQCSDAGLIDNLSGQQMEYFTEHYPGQRLMYCLGDDLQFDSGDTFEIILHGNANADFIDSITKFRTMAIGEVDLADSNAIMDAHDNNLDMFNVDVNNISNVTYHPNDTSPTTTTTTTTTPVTTTTFSRPVVGTTVPPNSTPITTPKVTKTGANAPKKTITLPKIGQKLVGPQGSLPEVNLKGIKSKDFNKLFNQGLPDSKVAGKRVLKGQVASSKPQEEKPQSPLSQIVGIVFFVSLICAGGVVAFLKIRSKKLKKKLVIGNEKHLEPFEGFFK